VYHVVVDLKANRVVWIVGLSLCRRGFLDRYDRQDNQSWNAHHNILTLMVVTACCLISWSRAIEQAVAHHETSRALKARMDTLRARLSTLTPRERQVFELVVQGRTNKQIAHQIVSTVRTIKAHRQRVMEKMRVQSLAELVSLAERLGILSPLPPR
jgi:RNA polymerase sigma factor (sigma-70 family)